jgi:hypothetical protein
MTKGEREDLQRLVRQREKVLKSAAKQRSAEMLADFENQMGAEYAFDDDEVWRQAVEDVRPLVAKAQQQIAKRCRELGIPARFAPTVNLSWQHRGYDNQIKQRREELRDMAVSRSEAIEAKAIVEIEMSCLQAQEKIAVAAVTSDAGAAFLAALPAVETLMPALSYAEIAGEADPPIVEQLVSPNTLRQRRFRERQRLAAGVTPARYGNAEDDDGEDDDGA